VFQTQMACQRAVALRLRKYQKHIANFKKVYFLQNKIFLKVLFIYNIKRELNQY